MKKLAAMFVKLGFSIDKTLASETVTKIVQAKEVDYLKRLAKKITGQSFDYPASQLTRYIDEIHNFYENLLALMPEHVYWKDINGLYLGCNNGVALSAGLRDRLEIIGKADNDMVWSDSSACYQKIDREAMVTGKTVTFEEPLTRVTGEKVIVLSSKVPLKDTEGKIIGVLGISTDITKLKEIEASLAKAKQVAEEANAAKSEFLAMMTHELRTPLNVILGMTQIMQAEELPKALKEEYLKAIFTSGQSLLGLINDILDFSKGQSKKLEIREEVFGLDPLVHQLQTEFSVKAQQHHIDYFIQRDPQLPAYLLTDGLRFRQVIYNLSDNALKFTSKGSVTVSIDKIPSKDPQKVGVRVIVKDTGIGIPKDKLESVFEEFTQVSDKKHDEYSRKYGGVGLGLAIVHQIIDLMDGTIKVDSELEKGTTFTCEFEFHLASEEQLSQLKRAEETPKKESVKETNITRSLSVLLVEDSYLPQIMAVHMLESLHCKVDVANDGNEALAKMQKEYDLVFMDMSLPDVNGIQVVKEYRRIEKPKRHQKIIALTANAHADDERRCREAGMDGFLTKPIMADQLKQIILDNQ